MSTKSVKRSLVDLKWDKSIETMRLDKRSRSRIESYADNIDSLPPILIDQDNHIIDGGHRFLAHALKERKEIKCIVETVANEKERRLKAVSMNSAHGAGLSVAEIKHNAIELYKLLATDAEIAKAISRSKATVHSYLKDSKAAWKDEQIKMVYELSVKSGWKQAEIAKHINSIRPGSITQRTVSEYLKQGKELFEPKPKPEPKPKVAKEKPTLDLKKAAEQSQGATVGIPPVAEEDTESGEANKTEVKGPSLRVPKPSSSKKSKSSGAPLRILKSTAPKPTDTNQRTASKLNDDDFDVSDYIGLDDDYFDRDMEDGEDELARDDIPPDVEIDEEDVAAAAPKIPDIKKFSRETFTFNIDDVDALYNINVALVAKAIAVHDEQGHVFSNKTGRLEEFLSEGWDAVFVRQ